MKLKEKLNIQFIYKWIKSIELKSLHILFSSSNTLFEKKKNEHLIGDLSVEMVNDLNINNQVNYIIKWLHAKWKCFVVIDVPKKKRPNEQISM